MIDLFHTKPGMRRLIFPCEYDDFRSLLETGEHEIRRRDLACLFEQAFTDYVGEIYHHIRHDPTARAGYLYVHVPIRIHEGFCVMKTGPTERGLAMISALKSGLVWDTDAHQVNEHESRRYWHERLKPQNGMIPNSLFDEIAALKPHCLQSVVQFAQRLRLTGRIFERNHDRWWINETYWLNMLKSFETKKRFSRPALEEIIKLETPIFQNAVMEAVMLRLRADPHPVLHDVLILTD